MRGHISKSYLRKEVLILGKNEHIVPVEGKCGIKGEGISKCTSIFKNQSDAIDEARTISQNQHSELIIHG
ncbi:MAG: DUF2188 domain-containing protein [Bacteroidaceae bacterium]|nr:DUF2188 domain-containing protein [Bacteroidaceae bacterium]